MKTFLVIIKSIKNQIKNYKKDLSHLKKRGGKLFYEEESYQMKKKYIIETESISNIYEEFKDSNEKIISLKEIKNTKKNDKITLGDLFKDHFVEYTNKYCGKPYFNIKSTKILKNKLLKIEEKEYKKK